MCEDLLLVWEVLCVHEKYFLSSMEIRKYTAMQDSFADLRDILPGGDVCTIFSIILCLTMSHSEQHSLS